MNCLSVVYGSSISTAFILAWGRLIIVSPDFAQGGGDSMSMMWEKSTIWDRNT